MARAFEQLAWEQTPLGVLGLRRRHDPTLGAEVFEVKLGDEFLMSSAFTVAEVALAELALAWCEEPAVRGVVDGSGASTGDATAGPGAGLEVAVGGLGLGFTTVAALADPRVSAVVVIEALPEVIGWHQQGLLADIAPLADDPRVRFVAADLFASLAVGDGLDPQEPGRRFDAVLVDIDHSPRAVLHRRHAAFYTPEGLTSLRGCLRDGGVFGLWSDDAPDDDFLATLGGVFDRVHAEVVRFDNPLTGGSSRNTVYLAR